MAATGIVGVGVATMDIYINQKRMYPGGNEYNVACHVAKCGQRAGFLGVFANDKAGELLEKSLVDVNVDCSMSHHEKGSSGYSLVELKEDGDRVFLDWNKRGVTDVHPIRFERDELEYLKSFEVCCMGRCASVSLDKIIFLANEGIDICYDFHAEYDEETIHRIAPNITYAFFSCSHLDMEKTDKVLRQAVKLGAKLAIGTRGSETLYAYDGENYYVQEPFKVKAKDALGAGDSFIASFLTKYLANEKDSSIDNKTKVQDALEFAAKYAASVVLIDGSIGVGYDVDPDRINEIINLESFN